MSSPVSAAGRTRRNALIVLGALVALALLVGSMLLLQKDSEDEADGPGGFRELRKDEFAAALIEAREKAGSWRVLEVATLNDKPNGIVESSVTWDGENVELALLPQASTDGEGEFRYADGDWYYFNPSESKTKPWLKLDREKSKAAVDALAAEADPRRQLAIFEDPSDFRVIGVENVGVAEAVHYRVTVAIEKVKEATSNPVVGNPGDQQVFDVWVDEEDQIVKMTIPTVLGGGIKSEEIRTFTGYGDDIVIETPPADQVRLAALTPRSQQEGATDGN